VENSGVRSVLAIETLASFEGPVRTTDRAVNEEEACDRADPN